MSTETGYNGWANYETWNVALWILAKSLEAWIEELNPLADDSSLFSDLMNAALGEVDWMEIARHFMDDVDKDGCCSECGADLDDGEGYDGKCGECADVKELDSDDAEVKS